MKNKILIIIMAFLPFLALHGQESIKTLYGLTSENSIIREITANTYLVYSDYPELIFILENGGSTASIMRLPKEIKSVSDFTIVDGMTVYFCGERNEMPIMGYFDLSSFPLSTIHYIETTGVNILTNIKAYDTYLYPPLSTTGTTKHVLMLGLKNNVGILIDAMSTSSNNWETTYITLRIDGGFTVIHDDIDILENYVIVASRDPLPSLSYKRGYIWYIAKPSPPYAPLLTSQEYFTIPNVSPSKRLKLTACEGKACVAAALAYKNDVPGINVYGYRYPYNIQDIRILDADIQFETLKALCYDSTYKTTELLVQYIGESIDSRILTLKQSTSPGNVVLGRVYSGHKINSMITQTYNSQHFIGTGVDVEDPLGLNIYRYKNVWQEIRCADNYYKETEDVDRMIKKDGSKTYIKLKHDEQTTDPGSTSVGEITICPQN